MENIKTYKKFSLVIFAERLLMIFSVISVIGVYVMYNSDNKFLNVFNIIGLVSLLIFAWKGMQHWINWIAWEKCDLEFFCLYLEKVLEAKRNKKNIKVHLLLLEVYLVLGCYDKGKKKIDELNNMYSYLSNVQKLELQLLYISYLSVSQDCSELKAEIQKASEMLNGLGKIGSAKGNDYQKSIIIRGYLAEEKWEVAIDILKGNKNATVYEKINNAFLLGSCYYNMGDYEQAFQELHFVSEYGRGMKYVALANDMLKKLPQKDTYAQLSEKKLKKFQVKKYRIFCDGLLACASIVVVLGVHYYSSYGNSIEEAYCRRHWCNEKDVTVLYQEKIADYEMAIISSKEKIAYCLIKKEECSSKRKYTIVDLLHEDKYIDDYETKLTWMGKIFSEEEKERSIKFYRESDVELQVWNLLDWFYQENEVFIQEDFSCVGISYYPIVDNVIVNGQPVIIERTMEVDGAIAYFWRIDGIDLEEQLWSEYKQ